MSDSTAKTSSQPATNPVNESSTGQPQQQSINNNNNNNNNNNDHKVNSLFIYFIFLAYIPPFFSFLFFYIL